MEKMLQTIMKFLSRKNLDFLSTFRHWKFRSDNAT